MSVTWTKGPWLYRGKSDDVYTTPTEGTNYSYGNLIFGFREACVPNDADLSLILAVPDLYDAIESAPDIMSMQPEEFYIAYTDWLSKARAALAKANGGES